MQCEMIVQCSSAQSQGDAKGKQMHSAFCCSTFDELWDDGGETERERNKLIDEVYNFVDIPTQTVGDEDEMPLISFGTGPGIENETRWEIKEAIQSGHRYVHALPAGI